MVCKAAMQETIRKGPWLEEEDERLATFVALMGERRWDSIARVSGLRRSGKSCRLRWLNYLRPDLKHEQLSAEEENIILKLQEQWGNKWSKIARKLPGRTDNEIKNYWRTYIRKKTQVEEHVKSQQERKYAKILEPQNLLTQRDAPKPNHYEQHGDTKEEISRATSEHPMDIFGSFDGACAISPSEAHLSDWICGPCNDQDAPKHHGECTQGIILDSSFQYPAWVPGDMDSLWDYSSVSLWETDRT